MFHYDNDSFRFTVRDNEGGWIGTPTFNLLMDPDVVVSIAEIKESNAVKLFPNPASDQVDISFTGVTASEALISILNVKGQVLDTVLIRSLYEVGPCRAYALVFHRTCTIIKNINARPASWTSA